MKEIRPRNQFQLNEERAVLLAKTLVHDATTEQKEALLSWAQELIEIRESNLPAIKKASRAYKASTRSKILIHLLKILHRELNKLGLRSKKLFWDDRGWGARLGLAGITVGVATFGSEGAGIVALGTGIGVPLWLVLGAGGIFLGAIVEELKSKK